MFYSTKAKLIASFVGVAAMVGFVSIFIGGRLLYKSMLNEATNRVRLDLNAAQEVYHTRIDFIKTAISITTSDSGFRSAVRAGRVTDLEERITRMAEPRSEEEETSGMALASAVPALENGRILAVVYGGILLNQTHQIVDTVRDTVLKNEVYKNRSIGTATLFFNDVRISTNVTTRNERRAVGTRVSKAVKDHVLLKGERWTERAFVVNDWYITAYDSIEDIFGDRVGMLQNTFKEMVDAIGRRREATDYQLLISQKQAAIGERSNAKGC